MIQIQDKIIWITGASSGIGEEMAYQLSEKGAKLILSSRRTEELERVKKACKGKYADDIKIITLDLSYADSLAQKADEALSIYGYIDILINNGGISQRATVLDTNMEVYRKIMEVDFFAPIQLSKLVLPSMIKRNFGQHVVITSATGLISTPLRSAYAAAKHALHGFYDALHAEVYDENIQVTLICPGFINTNVSFNALTGSGEAQGKHDKEIRKGLSPQKAVNKIVKAIELRKEEVYFGGMKEMTAIRLKRFFPSIFAKAVRNQAQ
jgi:dehydrogenase/reductase SDR family protein 7B